MIKLAVSVPPKTTAMRRLCIYFFYDNEGIVDEYVLDCLKDLSLNVTDTLFVSNGILRPESKKKLAQIKSVKVVERPNVGFDVWAYKNGIDTLGWDVISSYDEVIFMNFTIVGPLYPLKEMFDVMDARPVDFWGINVHSGEDYDPWNIMPDGYIPKHLQSHFIAVRRPMLESKEFQTYWNKMRKINSYQEAIGYHEAIFTDTFENHGFAWDSYVDTTDLEHKTSYPLLFMPTEVIKNRRSPFFKRKALILPMSEYVGVTHGLTVVDTLAVLEELHYDVRKIMPHILRTGNQRDIRQALNATRVIPTIKQSLPKSSVAIVAYVNSFKKYAYLEHYLAAMGEVGSVCIVASGVGKAKISAALLGKRGVKIVEGGHLEFLEAVERASKTHAYVGLLSLTNPVKSSIAVQEDEYYQHGLRSLFSSQQLMHGSIDDLENNDLYKVLASPSPLHAQYDGLETLLWRKYYASTKRLLKAMGVSVDVQKSKPPLSSLSGMYWISSQAVSSIDWQVLRESLKATAPSRALQLFNFSLPFIAQQSGYLVAYGMSREVAENYITIQVSKDTFKALNAVETHSVKVAQLSQLYLKRANRKLSERDAIKSGLIQQRDGTFKVEITVPYSSKYIRFDPVEGRGAVCDSIEVKINGVTREAKPLNAISYNGIDIFITNDSQYAIKGRVRKGSTVAVTFKNIDYYSQADFNAQEVLETKEPYGGPLQAAIAEMQRYYQDKPRR